MHLDKKNGTSWCRRCIVALSLLVPAAATAQPADPAEALFNRGVEDMNAGRYAQGCPAIAESQRLDPRPGTLFSLALCEDKWGRVLSTIAHYEEYLAVYERLPDDRKAKQGERPKLARAQIDKLKTEIPELTLTLPPNAPAGTIVKRDGQEITAASLGVAIPVEPGEIAIITQAPGGPVWEQRITIGKGEKKKITLEIKPAPAVVTPPPPPPPPAEPPRQPEPPPAPQGMSGQRKAAFAIGGVGIAGLVLGGVMGGLAMGQKGILDQHCGAAIKAPDAKCDPAGLEAVPRAKTFGIASTIGVIAGIAGLGTGVVLLLTDRPSASPGAGTRSPWIAAEVLPAGPAGATIGARGAW